MKTAAQMAKASDIAEENRKKENDDFQNSIRQSKMKEIEAIMEDSTAVYWRGFKIDFDLTRAEIEHFEKLGYKITSAGCYSGSGYHISW